MNARKAVIQPIRGKHAIEYAVFALEIGSCDQTQIKALTEFASSSLMQRFGFSSQKPLMEVEFKVENGASRISQNEHGREYIKNNTENEKPSWVLSIGRNVISLTCFNYDRWTNVRDFAREVISSIMSAAKQESIELNALALEYHDVFIIKETTPEQATTKVFNTKSKYLTNFVAEAPNLWHVHQGWFEKFKDENAVLNVLNVSTSKKATEITAKIHGVHRITSDKMMEGEPPIALTYEDINFEWFDSLHQKNKLILGDLLSDEAKISISLEE